jgi:hypothetical protein
LLAFGLGLTPAASQAQTAALHGRVLSTDDKPLAAAEVGVVDGHLIVASGPDGRYNLGGIAPGRSTIFVRAIGHRWATTVLVLTAGETLEQTFRLEPAVLTLPEVTVEAKWAKPARLAHTTKYDDFYRRRKAGHGTFLTRDRIDAANALRSFELLRGVNGVKVTWNPPGVPGTEVRFPRCTDFPPKVTVWLDGNELVYRPPPPVPNDWGKLKWRADAWGAWIELFDVVRPSDIEAIEVFRGLSQMPAEFRTVEACAAVAIWTRDGGRSAVER